MEISTEVLTTELRAKRNIKFHLKALYNDFRFKNTLGRIGVVAAGVAGARLNRVRVI